tara:strand:- start:3029 stop:3838 length:810 start_codon:yes stop_codon:yes gene_type:complete
MENIPKLVFIVPYRARENEKIHFSVYMKYIMEDYKLGDYEIYYSHQCDNRLFNRGAMKNIGFLVIKDKYPDHYKDITFVFNDVDTIPYKKNLLNYDTSRNIVKHFYGFEFALGGIFSIKGADFERINGFPNFWGYGYEDNVINQRVLQNNIRIDRDNFFKINSPEIIQFRENNPVKPLNKNELINYKNKKIQDNLRDIKNLDYKININNENTSVVSENQFIIDVTGFNTLAPCSSVKLTVLDTSRENSVHLNPINKVIPRQFLMRIGKK